MKKSELKQAIKEVVKELQLKPSPGSIKPKPEKQASQLMMFAGNINMQNFNKLSNLTLSLIRDANKEGYFDDEQECFELLIQLLEEDFKTGNPGEGEVFKLDL